MILDTEFQNNYTDQYKLYTFFKTNFGMLKPEIKSIFTG